SALESGCGVKPVRQVAHFSRIIAIDRTPQHATSPVCLATHSGYPRFMTPTQNLSPSHGSGLRLMLAILVVSLNLRGAITCVGPLLDQIQATFGLSATAAGLLASLPLFA